MKSFTFAAFLVETVSRIRFGFLLRKARYLNVSSSKFVSSTISFAFVTFFLIESKNSGVIFLHISIDETAISISLSSFRMETYMDVF